jgi:hypothetical protein
MYIFRAYRELEKVGRLLTRKKKKKRKTARARGGPRTAMRCGLRSLGMGSFAPHALIAMYFQEGEVADAELIFVERRAMARPGPSAMRCSAW